MATFFLPPPTWRPPGTHLAYASTGPACPAFRQRLHASLCWDQSAWEQVSSQYRALLQPVHRLTLVASKYILVQCTYAQRRSVSAEAR